MGITTVYRAYDQQERLLYVGISDGEFVRLSQHAASSPWTRYAVTITLERHPSRAHAERAEREALRTEDPVWNMDGRPLARFRAWMQSYPDAPPDDPPERS